MFWPADDTLKIEIALPAEVLSPAVRASLGQYVAELSAGLDLPANVDLLLTPVPALAAGGVDGLFHIRVNDEPCRLRWWPQLPLRSEASARELTAIAGTALWESRERLIDAALADRLRGKWLQGRNPPEQKPAPPAESEPEHGRHAAPPGRSAERQRLEFHNFLRLFLRHNHSLRHAEAFLRRNLRLAAEIDADHWFERAMEELDGLRYGASVAIAAELFAAQKQDLQQSLLRLAARLVETRGLVAGRIAIESAPLTAGAFRIRINDVPLPVYEAPLSGDLLFQNSPAAEGLGAAIRLLADPFHGSAFCCAAGSPELEARLQQAGLESWTHSPAGYTTYVLEAALCASGGSLLSPAVTAAALGRLRQDSPELVRVARARLGNEPPFHLRITSVLRRLAGHGVAVNDLPGILSGIAALSITASGSPRQIYYSVPGEALIPVHTGPFSTLPADALALAARLRLRALGAESLPLFGYRTVRRWLFLPAWLEGQWESSDDAARTRLAPLLVSQLAVRVLLDGIQDQFVFREYALVVGLALRAFVEAAVRYEFPSIRVVGREELPSSLYGNIEDGGEPLAARPIDARAAELPSPAPVAYAPAPSIPRLEIEGDAAPQAGFTPSDAALSVALVSSSSCRGHIAGALERLRLCAARAVEPESRQALAYGAYLLARRLISARETQGAAGCLQLAASLDPAVPIYHYDLAQVLDLLRQPQAATAAYRDAALAAPASAAWQATVARLFRQRGDIEEAIRFYRRAAALEPRNAEFHNLAGNSYYSAGAFGKAIESFRRAAELEPATATYHANLADALTLQGDYVRDEHVRLQLYHDAVAAYRRAIAAEPGSRFYQHLSWPLGRTRRFDEAAAALRKAIETSPDPKGAPIRFELAGCLSRQGNYSGAVKELEAMAADGIDSPELQEALAKANLGAGEYGRAAAGAEALARAAIHGTSAADARAKDLAAFAASLAAAGERAQSLAAGSLSSPDAAAANFSLAEINGGSGNLHAAIALYRRAATLAPGVPQYYRQLGNALYKDSDYAGAIEQWQRISPPDGLALNNIGTAYEALENTGLALENYTASAALPGVAFVPFYNIGRLKYRQRNWEGAREAFEHCLASEEGARYPLAHHNLGNCWWRLERVADAAAAWQTAVAANAQFAEPYFNLAVKCWRFDGEEPGRREAAAYWLKALQADRNLAPAEDNLEALRDKREPDLEIFDALRGR